jgi:CBS domain-containing protein
MKVKDILKQKGQRVVTIGTESTIQEAIDLLVRESIGALVVVEGQVPVGIVTERDVLRASAGGSSPFTERGVRSIMTARLILGDPNDEVERLMAIMTERRIRHVPIVDEERLAGIVSIGDVVKAKLQESDLEVHNLRAYIHGAAV